MAAMSASKGKKKVRSMRSEALWGSLASLYGATHHSRALPARPRRNGPRER